MVSSGEDQLLLFVTEKMLDFFFFFSGEYFQNLF